LTEKLQSKKLKKISRETKEKGKNKISRKFKILYWNVRLVDYPKGATKTLPIKKQLKKLLSVV